MNINMFQAKDNILRADQEEWGVEPRPVGELPLLVTAFRGKLLLLTRLRAVLPKTAAASLSGNFYSSCVLVTQWREWRCSL
jgi:hypothetical protein